MPTKVTWKGDNFLRDMEDATEAAMEEAGSLFVAEAQRYCPVDTGKLRDSIRSEVEGLEMFAGSDLDYSVPVELGTRRAPPQPYLRPAFDSVLPMVVAILEQKAP
jgi:HK97 gp10 family phage protein